MTLLRWNVDTQNDFMRDDAQYKGKLVVPKAYEIENNLELLTLDADQKGDKVVNTADWHEEDSKELSKNPDFKSTYPEHCRINTFGAEFIKATYPNKPYVIDWRDDRFDTEKLLAARNIVLYKDAFDIFAGSKHAEAVYRLLDPKKVLVYGVATNVCVDFAVMGLLERNAEVYVVEDAIKELPGLPLPYRKWKDAGAHFTKTKYVLEGRI